MRKIEPKQMLNKYIFGFFISLICFMALFIRLKCCFCGFPIHTHPDEFATVDYAIEMLERHSWEAQIYSRPDHFEIKLDAIVFSIASWIMYHKPPYEAFQEHEMSFILLARGVTTLFGVGLIPVVSCLCGRLLNSISSLYRKGLQLFSSLLICFSYTLSQHSAYATPDVILTFFVMLFTLFMYEYMVNGDRKSFIYGLITIGVGITIKYPAAILCSIFALVVLYRKIRIEKSTKDIFRCVLISVLVIVSTVFVISPNIITNVDTVINNLIIESGAERFVGVDGLSFWGNLKFYIEFITSEFGYITIVPFFIGLINIFREHKAESLALLTGPIFLVSLSVFSIHWTRWMIPALPFYVIVVSYGLVSVIVIFNNARMENKKVVRRLVNTIVYSSGLLVLFNGIIASASLVKYSSLPNIILLAEEFCNAQEITRENSIFDGRTPLSPSGSYRNIDEFTFLGDKITPILSKGNMKYYVMCDIWKSLYYNERERYAKECKLYEAIEKEYDMIYHVEPDGNYSISGRVIDNILGSVEYLVKDCSYTGYPISIYQLTPENYVLMSNDGRYLTPVREEIEAPLYLRDEVYYWTRFDNGDGTFCFLTQNSGLSLGVKPSEERFALFVPEENDLQKCIIKDCEGRSKIVFVNDGETLTAYKNRVDIESESESEEQLWILSSTND